MASIICRWKKSTRTLNRVGNPANLRDYSRRDLDKDVTKNCDGHSGRASALLFWKEENFIVLPEGQPLLPHSTNQACVIVAKQKPLLNEKAAEGISDHEN